MAPDHTVNTGCFWLETNRHSPRIFNKNATKLDISTVNNKIDFMRSLNLFCMKNTKASYSKINSETSLQRSSVLLKKCSVVINSVKCEKCGVTLKNQSDIASHKNLHRLLENNGQESNNDTTKKSNSINEFAEPIMQENCIECNDNNNNNNSDTKPVQKVKPYKKNAHRRKSKDAVTKVTLKIGGEIISKVYCKKKYLNKVCSNEDKASRVHHHENCESCIEIKDILYNTKVDKGTTNVSLSPMKQSDTEQIDRNVARLRKMAAALVEQELQRKALQNSEQSELFNSEEGFSEVRNDDAVVPVAYNATDEDDDIQEVLRITKNVDYLNNRAFYAHFEKEIPHTISDHEIITIDDENFDCFEEDCVIVDERVPQENPLRNEEQSYVFHVSCNDNANVDALRTESSPILLEKRKVCPDTSIEDESLLKKKKIERTLQTQFNCSEYGSTRKVQKENKNCSAPTIKLSQFALPLRLINF